MVALVYSEQEKETLPFSVPDEVEIELALAEHREIRNTLYVAYPDGVHCGACLFFPAPGICPYGKRYEFEPRVETLPEKLS